MEALVNDKINFTKQQWEDLVKNELTESTLDGRFLEYLAHVPELTKCAKDVMQRSDFPNSAWAQLRLEVERMRDRSKADIDELRTRLESYDPTTAPAKFRHLLHANHLRMVGLALGTGIILNWILIFLVGYDQEISDESAEWTEEIIRLSEVATQYQPLGSLAMVVCLQMSWLGAPDASTKQRIKALIINYERACVGDVERDWIADMVPLTKQLSVEEPQNNFLDPPLTPWRSESEARTVEWRHSDLR
ncbi:MAG: hypothetical protein Q9218_007730 [Villophora microphyllina]